MLTSDVKDFRELPADEHEGVLVVFDEKRSAHEIAAAVLDIIAAYSDRDELRGYEYVDQWFCLLEFSPGAQATRLFTLGGIGGGF